MPNSLTRNQSLVLNTLLHAKAPLSAYTILDRLRGEGFRAPLQVYRALEKLIEKQYVHRLDSANAFMACAKPEGCTTGLNAFMICEKCGHAREIPDTGLQTAISCLAQKNGFLPQNTNIEIRGLCMQCTIK
ncbi:Fur family transcriptional regulator [Bartonella sp. DGB2]|uniref:Fur family transcriptional regulator n=1 Tax=Bartonella sp. DGB2 TaxID=3388426 RepID=UPI00399038AD